MFDLVNDIESYPEFLYWCQDSRVIHSSNTEVIATLNVGLEGIHKCFTTKNSLERPHQIDIDLVDGPFKSLQGTWRFDSREEPGCVVGLRLDFEVAHTPLDMVFGAFFEEVARSQVAAFIKRAEKIYG
jgi:ribosome-associated toxin RatA of RatAB toxin-antitoxin module